MPRPPRLTEIGYYHVLNRGVERRDVFINNECYDSFLTLIRHASVLYTFSLHAYCLMSNHYHLLIETKSDNISEIMKYINVNYAKWFNQYNDRSGHLWQGRYKSYYILDDTHFWTVAKYIERNPIVAKIVSSLDAYPYQSYHLRLHSNNSFSVLIEESKILEMNTKDYGEYLESELSGEIIKSMYKVPRVNKERNNKMRLTQSIEAFFQNDKSRNENIRSAFEYGHTKAAIADYLNLSSMAIRKIITKQKNLFLI